MGCSRLASGILAGMVDYWSGEGGGEWEVRGEGGGKRNEGETERDSEGERRENVCARPALH